MSENYLHLKFIRLLADSVIEAPLTKKNHTNARWVVQFLTHG